MTKMLALYIVFTTIFSQQAFAESGAGGAVFDPSMYGRSIEATDISPELRQSYEHFSNTSLGNTYLQRAGRNSASMLERLGEASWGLVERVGSLGNNVGFYQRVAVDRAKDSFSWAAFTRHFRGTRGEAPLEAYSYGSELNEIQNTFGRGDLVSGTVQTGNFVLNVGVDVVLTTGRLANTTRVFAIEGVKFASEFSIGALGAGLIDEFSDQD